MINFAITEPYATKTRLSCHCLALLCRFQRKTDTYLSSILRLLCDSLFWNICSASGCCKISKNFRRSQSTKTVMLIYAISFRQHRAVYQIKRRRYRLHYRNETKSDGKQPISWAGAEAWSKHFDMKPVLPTKKKKERNKRVDSLSPLDSFT